MRRIQAAIIMIMLILSSFSFAAAEEEFVPMAETESRILLLNEKNLQVRIYDKATGQSWDTCVMDGEQGNKTVKNNQKSAAVVTYITNFKNATMGAMDSFSNAVRHETFEIQKTENGFQVLYTIGSDSLIIDDLPKAIRVDKYQKLKEEAGWSHKDLKAFQEQYRAVKMKDLPDEYMIRVKDDSLSVMLIKKIHKLIFDSGIYTKEDMTEDNAAVQYERSFLPKLRITVRYQLDGDDLLVTLPADQLIFTPENEITEVELLPYFLSADTHHEGFMLIPDGSGTLIRLNNQKLSATSYYGRFYGEDVLINANTYRPFKEKLSFPVFGMKRTDGAMLAIIEKGAEMAALSAGISGKSDEFNRISPRFIIREVEHVSLAGNESITSPRMAEDVYTGDIVMRYKWFPNKEISFVDMAKIYQQYLIERNWLTPCEPDENAPFFAEMIGAAAKDDFFLGIPYASSVQATTPGQAQEIYEKLREENIKNIQLIFSGLFSGGVKNASLTKAVPDQGMGKPEQLQALSSLLEENGDHLFAGCFWGRVFTTKNFNRLSHAARRHDGEPAQVFTFSEPMLKASFSDRKGYYISPYYLKEYTEKALRSLEKYHMSGVALYDLGNTLTPDYRRKAHLSRIHAVPEYEEVLSMIGKEYLVMLEKPLLYALSCADYVTDLPSHDNGYRVSDESVPFIQYVLEGCVPYSGESWNLQAFKGMKSQFLWALESKTAPKFTFTWEKPTVFMNTKDMDTESYFSTHYEEWVDTAGKIYEEYNAFYQKVKDAHAEKHEILEKDVRAVTYSNGVKVFLNYGLNPATVNGTIIEGQGYIILEGVGT